MIKSRDGFRGGIDKYDFSLKSVSRILILLILPLIAYTIGIFPIIYITIFFVNLIDLFNLFQVFLLSFFLTLEFLMIIILLTFIPGIFIRIFRLKVDEGEYELSINDWNFFKYSLYFALYRPSLKLIGIFPLLPLRLRFLKLVGLKIGKTSILTGTELIYDPYMVEIGEQTLIGGWTHISGHVGEKKLIVKKVKIGNNCLIGGKSTILSGVVIEDDVTLGLNSIVLKDKILKKGRFYAGIPAKEIIKK